MISNFDGITENNKPSSKVLRPPGGGSSDIFGADIPQTPRSVKNHMQSNIFSSEKNAVKNNGDQPRRAQKNVDSYARLFGEPERPMTPARNHMKSSIPFGANTEAAQQLLANGGSSSSSSGGSNSSNGHHHTNGGKCGSVSSASSSVSSSTENLKMNGISKTVFRNMSNIDEACPSPTPTPSTPENESQQTLKIDMPCHDGADEKSIGSQSARSKISEAADVGAGDVASQTRRDTGCNPERQPYSYTQMSSNSGDKNKDESANNTCTMDKSSKMSTPPRNPITGLGLGEDGIGGIRPKKTKNRRDGNPVTGEGYKSSNDNNHAVPSLNGANQIINKNRIPPGGFSSGLW